jgi:hypothetical protein
MGVTVRIVEAGALLHRIRQLAGVGLILILLPRVHAAEEVPSEPADAKVITGFIEQLGSPEFQMREAASRALDEIGRPALAALRHAAREHDDAEVRWRARRLVQRIENTLEQLLEDYKSYGLPLPPKLAPLVRFESVMDRADDGQEAPRAYAIGFLIKAGTPKEPAHILRGRLIPPRELGSDNPPTSMLDPARATPEEIGSWIADAYDELLVLAIQCKSRGWNSLAQRFFKERPKEVEEGGPGVWLRHEAWHYWEVQLTKNDGDWHAASRCLHTIIRTDASFDTQENRALAKSLDLALAPSKAKPGSVEQLLDALVDASSVSTGADEKSDSPYIRLVESGFDAVPAMIDHLDDERLTRYNPYALHPDALQGRDQYRVNQMVSHLLQQLAGEDLRDSNDPDQQAASCRLANRNKALAWWRKATQEGEQAYILAHVLPEDCTAPNEHLCRLILKKYPQHLSTVYRTILDKRPLVSSVSIVEMIAKSELPRERKVELLIYGTRHHSRNQREVVFEVIANQDHEQFVETVLRMLEELPRTPKGSYWQCPEQAVVSLVLRKDDAWVWKALEGAARRVDVGLRMQLLRRVANNGDENVRLKERLAFLRSFLDDSTLRDMNSDPDKFVAVPAGHEFPRLEVRNYAALEIARLLKLDRAPQPSWDDTQWARLREYVRESQKH